MILERLNSDMLFAIFPDLEEIIHYASIKRPFFKNIAFKEDDNLVKKVSDAMEKSTLSYVHYDDAIATDWDYDKDTCVFLVKDGQSNLLGTINDARFP